MKMLFDRRGHHEIYSLLEDVAELGTLVSGDCAWIDADYSWGVEIKEITNVLSSVLTKDEATGFSQFYSQMQRLTETYDIPVLLVYGVYSPTKDGWLRIPEREFHWRYTAVERLLFDAWCKGICVLREPSLRAAALVIRSLYEKSGSRLEPRKAKFFSYSGKSTAALRLLAALPGINRTLAERVHREFRTPRAAFTAKSWAGIEGIGKVKNKQVQEVLDEKSAPPKENKKRGEE